MYLMYIDESGDCGKVNSPSKYFVLSAIVINQDHWLDTLNSIINFRKHLRDKYGLLMKEEIHASEFVNGRPKLRKKINRVDRILILRECLLFMNTLSTISLVTVRCDKANIKNEVFEYTWNILLQRLHNTLGYTNFPKSANDQTDTKGMIIADNTDSAKLNKLLRKSRRFNYVPNTANYGTGSRSILMHNLIEDPVYRDSYGSYLHQFVDVVVYFARQYYEPNNHIKKKGCKRYYGMLSNVINPHATKYNTNFKIVEI